MKCYNKKCNRECDKYIYATCLNKRSKEQIEILESILKESDNSCPVCFKEMVQAKYRKEDIELCTSCGTIKTKRQEYRLINIREAV